MRPRLSTDTRGAGLTEYLILVACVALVAFAGYRMFGDSAQSLTDEEGNRIARMEGWTPEGGGEPHQIADVAPGGAEPKGGESKLTKASPSGGCLNGVCKGQCFVAGTPVATERGLVAIETLLVGDAVLARDERTGEIAARPIVRTFVTPGREVIDLELVAESGAPELVGVTPEHPFFVQGQGWVRAGELSTGALAVAANGSSVVIGAAEPRTSTATVYNLEVEGFHTYFVGKAAAWVHNQCDPLGGDLWEPATQKAIENVANSSAYFDERQYRLFAEAVFGQDLAKDEYIAQVWARHERKEIIFPEYWAARKKVEAVDWFPSSWKALSQGLAEGNPHAIRAVKKSIADAKADGEPVEWGGERRRTAETILLKHEPIPHTVIGTYVPPDVDPGIMKELRHEDALGISDWYNDQSDETRKIVNDALAGQPPEKQAELLKELAGDEISRRVSNPPDLPGDEWLEQFPPNVHAGVMRLDPEERGTMGARWMSIRGDERKRIWDEIGNMVYHPNGPPPPDTLAQVLSKRLVPGNDSVGRMLRYEWRLKKNEIGFKAFVQLTGTQIRQMAKHEQKIAAAQEADRKADLNASIQKIMGDPGLKKAGQRSAKMWEVAKRTPVEESCQFGKGFVLQAGDTVVGLGNMIIHPIDTAEGLWFAATNPGKTAAATIVALEEASVDEDEFMGRVMFELTLVAATAGLGEGANAGDKGRKVAMLAEEAAKAGQVAKAARLANMAERIALSARRKARRWSTSELHKIADDAEGSARRARAAAEAAKAAEEAAGVAKKARAAQEARKWADALAKTATGDDAAKIAKEAADYADRQRDIKKAYEAVQKGDADPPPGVSRERLKQAVEGDAATGERIPLTFKDKPQFDRFKNELEEVFKSEGIDDVTVQQVGSGTTGWKGNPKKPGPFKPDGTLNPDAYWGPGSDVDFAVFSDQALAQAKAVGAPVNTNVVQGGKYTVLKNGGGVGNTSLGKKLEALAKKWDAEIYGDAARAPGFEGFDFKLNLSNQPFGKAPVLVKPAGK